MTDYGMALGVTAAIVLQCRTQVLRTGEVPRLREARRVVRALATIARLLRRFGVAAHEFALLASRRRWPLRQASVGVGRLLALISWRGCRIAVVMAEWVVLHAVDD